MTPSGPTVGASEPTNSLFEEQWWLDAVAPGAWHSVIVKRKGAVVGRLPYVVGKRLGLTAILQPPLTPCLGPWIERGEGAASRRHGSEQQIFGELLDALPPVSVQFHQFAPGLISALPLHWRGFTATPRYTYRIEDLSDLEGVLAGMSSSTRRQVRKAEKQYGVREGTLDELLRLSGQSLSRSGGEGAPEAVVRRLWPVVSGRSQGKVLVAEDGEGRAGAAVFLVWDSRSLYYLMGGQDDVERGGGAPSLLLWEGIKHAAEVSSAFDFEGSMIPAVERFFRGFGGHPTQYFAASKMSRWLTPLSALKTSIRGEGDRP